ncbi:transglutaminase domain-containing protein [Actinotalea sp. BY-33]|uniref:Transglutaminase domain-containing protein n=2 Tax=Actinotalea soli TaxID=2819234 RepID=A0A939RST4_9CELL|nr:transglutaminase domain-containing protein [Actinotalea soli]
MRPQGRRAWVDVLVLVIALGLALLPLVPVYGWPAATPAILGGLLLGAAIAGAGARWRWPALVTSAVSLVVYLLAGGALAAPTTTVLGVLPSLQTVVQLLASIIRVWKEVLTLDPSLGASGTLLAAPYLLALVGAITAVSAALRAGRRGGAWAGLVPVAVLGLAVLLGTKDTVLPVAAGIAMAVLLLGWAAWRRGNLVPRRVLALVSLGAVALASGAVAGPVVAEQSPRFVLRDEMVPPFDPRDHPSPLAGFRRFVKDWDETALLTVRGLPEGTPVRLATLDAYDGVVWNVAGSEAAEGSGEFRRVGETIETSVRGERTEVEFEVHELPLVWLPTVGYAERFDFAGPRSLDLAADLRYNDATGTAVLTAGVAAGTRWQTTVVVPSVPDDEAIGNAGTGNVSLPEVDGVPDAVPLFAGEVAGTATSPVLIARTLEQGLAERGWFSHGLTAEGQYPSLSGHGADRMTTLLTGELMVGDGEQYASAMALMAREMGLPARVVLGFVPDEEQAGAQEITIHGEDVQAWVEVSFAGHGWVPFFPTPDESRTPREDTPTEQSEPQPQVVQPPPPPPDPVTPPDDDPEQASTEDTEEDAFASQIWRTVLTVAVAVGIPVVLLVLPLLLIALAKRRRRERRRTAAVPVARVQGGWEEVLDHARDLRRPAPRASTRREIAVGLTAAFAAPHGRSAPADPDVSTRRAATVGGPVAGLAAGADAVVFGPGEPAPEQVEAYWQQVDAAIAAMHEVVPRRQRWLARWSLASLRARRREQRRARPQAR